MLTFEFPVGYHSLHPTKIIDFQLNRWHSFGYARLEEMRTAGQRIKGLADWKGEFLRQAEIATTEGRSMNAAFHVRAAEFFTRPDDPQKLPLYDRFLELFYGDFARDEPIQRHRIPFGSAWLPAYTVPRQSAHALGTLVIHGGFDSFIEEFYSMATWFAHAGYDVVLFEGPGQGGALRHASLPLSYEWEAPARAVLDYFDLLQVDWLGISMGGWLCFRAAAFEPRIRRVIASSIAYDYMQFPPKAVADFARWLFKHPRTMERMSEWKMRALPQERWGIENLMFITKNESVLAAGMALTEFNHEHQQPERVTQDVLILTGAEDHFVPLKMHALQKRALVNARSITDRIFTAAEQAQNHCQVGNIGLALSVMGEWLAASAPPETAPPETAPPETAPSASPQSPVHVTV
jgi:pimeloyl-ACP methyl ester carboxylesterase